MGKGFGRRPMLLLRSAKMRRKSLSLALAMSLLAVLAAVGTSWAEDSAPAGDPAPSSSAPTIVSDQDEYAPGDTVVLTGENWQPGESVQIHVEDDQGKTWDHDAGVTAGEDGTIRDEFTLPGWFVATYKVTATGDVSGVATTTFRDGTIRVKNASTVPAAATVTYKLEKWSNASNCPSTTPNATQNFTITGPNVTTISPSTPAGVNSIGTNKDDSVKVSFVSASAGWGFDKWQQFLGLTTTNDGSSFGSSSSQSFCVNVSDSNFAATYSGFVKSSGPPVTPAVANAGSDQSAGEGSTVNLDGTGTTGTSPITYSWSQTGGPSVTLSGANTATPSFTAPDGPATLTFRLTASNSGGSSTDDVQVNVNNVAPSVAFTGGATSADEGSTKTYTYSISDPGDDTVSSVATSCGANGTKSNASNTNTSGSFDCTFPDGPASSTVSVQATDSDSAAGNTDTKSVTINNVAPSVAFTGGATSADEGSTKTYTYSISDPGDDTVSSVATSCGANGTKSNASNTNTSGSFDCTFPDGPASSTVSVQATDSDSAAGNTDTKSVTINNVAPSADAGGPYSGPWGSPGITFSGSATDPAGPADTLSYEWDFDYDGSNFDVDGTGASPTHEYAGPGTYTVALRVKDEDGGVSTIKTATVTVGKRQPTLTYTGVSSKQYSDSAALSATLLDGSTPIANADITFTIGSQSVTVKTNSSGLASTTLKIDQAPGTPGVATTFAGNSLYSSASDSDPFTVLKEDARAYYTGAYTASTSSPSSSTATVTLAATIKDITAVTGDPAFDSEAGDIRKAKVTFVDGSGAPLAGSCSDLSVGLVSNADPKIGTVTCSWSVNIGNADSQSFTVGIKVNNYYTRYESTDNTIITVSKPLDNFITGGGYLINDRSAGQTAGAKGQKTNFGFNVKFNKQKTNLQGNINTIVRNGARVYQIKGNSMTSLSVNVNKATFNGKSSIQDITNPTAPQSVDGNATLQVTMTDNGEPGKSDTIGITVWSKSGGMWFSSNWDSTSTVEQLLDGGNLLVH